MYNETISTIIGFVAMLFAMSSYFVKKKSIFLVAQAGAILSLAFSCLFTLPEGVDRIYERHCTEH